jgi:hypothetical protein
VHNLVQRTILLSSGKYYFCPSDCLRTATHRLWLVDMAQLRVKVVDIVFCGGKLVLLFSCFGDDGHVPTNALLLQHHVHAHNPQSPSPLFPHILFGMLASIIGTLKCLGERSASATKNEFTISPAPLSAAEMHSNLPYAVLMTFVDQQYGINMSWRKSRQI